MMQKILSFFILVMSITAFLPECGDIDETEKIAIPKFHTASDEGIWFNQSGTHVPLVSYTGPDTVRVLVPLKPSRNPRHFIEVIALLDGDREIDSRKFNFTLNEAQADFRIPDPTKGTYKIIAKCNLHDMWIAQVPARQPAQPKKKR
jgi:desulfoferrodoxin (superoxide reductase-like protein)